MLETKKNAPLETEKKYAAENREKMCRWKLRKTTPLETEKKCATGKREKMCRWKLRIKITIVETIYYDDVQRASN